MLHQSHVDAYKEREKLERVRVAVVNGEVSHTRVRRIGGPVVCVYRRDSASPTGVSCLAILDDTSELMAILRQRPGLSPLSPTEL